MGLEIEIGIELELETRVEVGIGRLWWCRLQAEAKRNRMVDCRG